MHQNLVLFLLSAMLISLSGVLSPGPMTAAAIEQGASSRRAGIYIALGHGAIEFPLIFLLALGAGRFLQISWVRIATGLLGGTYLLFVAKGLLFPAREAKSEKDRKSSFSSGMFISLTNPYFPLWWATIGLGLVISALRFGIFGVLALATTHWLCDLTWYGFLSAVSARGREVLGAGFFRKVSFLCGAAMVLYSGIFIMGALRLLL